MPLTPVVSDIIYDKKTMADLCIYEISHAFASVSSQQKVIILCNCVLKDNIEVRFYELDSNGNLVWEDNAQFLPRNVYKQTAISFKIPKYRLEHISQPVECYVQLRRKSDGHTSQSKKFYYLPDSAYQPINQLIKSLSNSLNVGSNFAAAGYGNLANYGSLGNWSSLGNGLGSNHFSSGFVPNGLNHSPATYSLMANNLANCLSNSLSPNFVNNLAIPNLPQSSGLLANQQQQQQQQQQYQSASLASHPSSSTASTPLNGKKRPRVESTPQYNQNPAYGLHQAKRNCLNKNLLSTPYSTSNQIILNNFNPSGAHTLANTLIDLDNLQQFSGNNMITHLPASSAGFSMTTQANPSTIPNSSFSSTNTSLNQSSQELQIEPTYLDFKNQLYQSQMAREELSQRANVVS